MLEKLFGSKARVKILKLFLSHTDEKYYIRQISRNLGLQLNSVRRELENLESFGILTSRPMDSDEEKRVAEDIVIQTKGDIVAAKKRKPIKPKPLAKSDKKYFRVNQDFVLYEEIRALILKAQILYEKDFSGKLQQAGSPKLLILSGMFVNQPLSKVDLFIVGRVNKQKLNRLIRGLENDLGQEINYCLMGTQEFKYRRDITDVFLYDILEGRKLVVLDDLGVS